MRVFLVDDHELFRSALRMMLEGFAGVEVVGEAPSAREALRDLEACAPDVALIDITMPGSNGLALIRELRRLRSPGARLVLTMHSSADFVTEAFDAGASGYALKDDSPSMLLDAMRAVVGGNRYLSSRLPEAATATLQGDQKDGAASHQLSPREHELFDLLVRGYRNREIARQLFISVKTVETHRTHIFKKLGVHSLADLVRVAAQRGLLPSATPR
ncbi:MAG TPA: response regulator transcription factor [Polyangia bacterium]|nr:response regulator transcription factor [Polyangia bacterium]